MFDGIQAALNAPVPAIDLILLGSIVCWLGYRLEKRVAKIEADKTQSDMDAWFAKRENEPQELGQVYPPSVHKEWERRRGGAEIAKLAHDWGFHALGRDRPYVVPAGEHAKFVRPGAWFAVLPDGNTWRMEVLSTKQKSALHSAAAWHDSAAIIGPIRASEHVNWPNDWDHQESEDWSAQREEEAAAKRIAEYAREWRFPFLGRGPKPPSWDRDDCYWRAVPAGGILYKTKPVFISAEQTGKLDAIPAADRLHGFIAAAPRAETVKRKRIWGLMR
jgi:hypothetical protein